MAQDFFLNTSVKVVSCPKYTTAAAILEKKIK